MHHGPMIQRAHGLLFLLTLLVCAGQPLPAAEKPGKVKKAARKETADQFFSEQKIRTFQFEISEPDIASLRRSPRTNVKATVREGAHVLTNVAIRLKGMGSFRMVDEKASFAVKFNEFARSEE